MQLDTDLNAARARDRRATLERHRALLEPFSPERRDSQMELDRVVDLLRYKQQKAAAEYLGMAGTRASTRTADLLVAFLFGLAIGISTIGAVWAMKAPGL